MGKKESSVSAAPSRAELEAPIEKGGDKKTGTLNEKRKETSQ